MSELGTYHGASTIMRKTLDWNPFCFKVFVVGYLLYNIMKFFNRRYGLLRVVCCYKALNYINTYVSHYYSLCYVCILVYLQHSYSLVCIRNYFFNVKRLYSTISIFSCLNLSLRHSSCFNPAVYLTALPLRVNIHLVSAIEISRHITIPYDRRG
jgi:hypothetical protein